MRRSIIALGMLAAGSVMGCRGQVSDQPQIVVIRNMHRQEKYKPQERSVYFQDGRNMRNPPAHTFSREQGALEPEVELGVVMGTRDYVPTIPPSVIAQIRHRTNDARWLEGSEAMVARGRERFGIYCAPCHGSAGDGAGIVYTRSRTAGYQYPAPATLHDNRLRHSPDGQLYATIRNGVRNMPGYASQIPVNDRWAIVAYVRALQLSQATAGASQ